MMTTKRRTSRAPKSISIAPAHGSTTLAVLEKSIIDIDRMARIILEGPITTEAVVLLIHDSMPQSDRVSRRVIRTVLESAANLKNKYIRKK